MRIREERCRAYTAQFLPQPYFATLPYRILSLNGRAHPSVGSKERGFGDQHPTADPQLGYVEGGPGQAFIAFEYRMRRKGHGMPIKAGPRSTSLPCTSSERSSVLNTVRAVYPPATQILTGLSRRWS